MSIQPRNHDFSCTSQACCCVENAPGSCRPIHTWITYEGNGRKVSDKHEIFYVAPDTPASEWMGLAREQASKIGKANGCVSFVSVWFQMDGGNKPYRWWRWLQDLRNSITLRGKRFSRRDYVPIAPTPAPPRSLARFGVEGLE